MNHYIFFKLSANRMASLLIDGTTWSEFANVVWMNSPTTVMSASRYLGISLPWKILFNYITLFDR